MARKLTYNITRFDGGMSDDIRVEDLSKCAYVSHFNIYCDPHKMVPMPGYVADQDTAGGGANDLKNYNVKAFHYEGSMRAVSEVSGGGGNKLWEKATPTTSEWTASTTGEGSYDLKDGTFLFEVGSRLYYVTEDSGNTYISYYSGTVTDAGATMETFTQTYNHVAEYGFDDTVYTNAMATDIITLGSSSITDPGKDTGTRITDIQSGDEQYGLIGYTFYPFKGRLLLWDSGSALVDQKIDFGKGIPRALGYTSGTWVGVVDENLTADNSIFEEQANSSRKMKIKYAAPQSARTMYEIEGATATNAKIVPIRGEWEDSMLFYARVPTDATPTTYREGVWAVGRCKEDSPLAISVLLDTSELGSMQGLYNVGQHFFFAHAGDGSVSRLDAIGSGTYDVECVYESLMFGSNSPFLKEFKGISVLTEDLPSGGSVEVKYRFDENDSWTSLGTSSTTGDEEHSFTRASGVPIGKFREIQFRVDINGNVPVKGIYITLMETDDLPFNH